MATTIWQRLWRVGSIENHCFLPALLGPNSVVVDLGANTGFFTRQISIAYGVRSYGVEANPDLCAALTNSARTTFHNVAITDHDGPLQLNLSDDHTTSSVVTESVPQHRGAVTVDGRTLPTFMRDNQIDKIDLLKVDIEGAEVPLFASLSDTMIQNIPQISIEFHDDHGFIMREDFTAIRDRLHRLGFAGVQFASNNTNWLFYQPKLLNVGAAQQAYLRLVIRNVRGALRRLGFRSR